MNFVFAHSPRNNTKSTPRAQYTLKVQLSGKSNVIRVNVTLTVFSESMWFIAPAWLLPRPSRSKYPKRHATALSSIKCAWTGWIFS